MDINQNLTEGLKQLQSALGQWQGVDKIAEVTANMLPSDVFHAEIDGHKLEISRAVSGTAIVFKFQSKEECGKRYDELKSQKQGFFNRFFKK